MDLLLNYGLFLDGLKIQSSELSPPWLSAAGAFFCHIFAFFPKTPPELGSRLGFGVQGLAGGSLGKFKGVIQN